MSTDPMKRRAPLSRRVLALCMILSTALPIASSAAVPTISIHWNDCTGPINIGPGSGPIQHIVVSADDLGAPTYGFEVVILLGSLAGGLADAWRFEPGGCEAGRFHSVLQSGGASCPLLVIPNAQTISDFSYVNVGGADWRGRITFAEASQNLSAAPGARNTLVDFVLDMSDAGVGTTTPDSCGCLARPVCFGITAASYLDAQKNELNFADNQSYLTWNDPTNSKTHCGGIVDCFPPCVFDSLSCSGDAPTPAIGTSWGHVKGMYRERAR